MFVNVFAYPELDAAPRARLRETRTPRRGCRHTRAIARIAGAGVEIDVEIDVEIIDDPVALDGFLSGPVPRLYA